MICQLCRKEIKDEEYESHQKICKPCPPDSTPNTSTYIAGGVTGAAIGGVAAPTIISAVGFGSLGPVAGSTAAAVQASVGNVAAGGLFATLQSAGMGGAAALGTVVVISAVGVGLAGLGAIRLYHLAKTFTPKNTN